MKLLEKIKENIKEKNIRTKKERLNSKYKSLYGSDSLYEEYKLLDVLIVYLEEVGISSYNSKYDSFRSKITFKDNTNFVFWDNDIAGSYMSNGRICFSNGESLEWNNKCPSYEVLYKFTKALEKFKKKKDSDDYQKYLPIKIQRKMKLKNLK